MNKFLTIVNILVIMCNICSFMIIGEKTVKLKADERYLIRRMGEQRRLQARVLRMLQSDAGQQCLDNLTKAEIEEFFNI